MRISNRFLIWFLVIITVHNFVLLSYLYLENRYELSLELNERSRLLDSLSIDYQNKHSNLNKQSKFQKE